MYLDTAKNRSAVRFVAIPKVGYAAWDTCGRQAQLGYRVNRININFVVSQC
jgi:hypothetical protein